MEDSLQFKGSVLNPPLISKRNLSLEDGLYATRVENGEVLTWIRYLEEYRDI